MPTLRPGIFSDGSLVLRIFAAWAIVDEERRIV
jgi:hypothetical protein